MNQYPAANIRNIGLFSHGGAGKTSLAEAMLFNSQATTRLGKVEDGNTVSDYDPDEIKRHISISLALLPIEWSGHKINVLDTPGYADFGGEVRSALRVADAALILLDASAGVEVGTELAWRLAEQRQMPRFIVVNKMDRENADFYKSVDAARQSFGTSVVPAQIPIGKEKGFSGVIDLLSQRAFTFVEGTSGVFQETDVPDELQETAVEYRQKLIESIAESDEELMNRYLNDEEISLEELTTALRQEVANGSVVPIFAVSSTGNKGIQQLMEGIIANVPAADQLSTTAQFKGDTVTLNADPSNHLAAVVFKSLADPHVGRVSYFRVYSGAMKANSNVHNTQQGKAERIGQLFFARGKDHLNVDTVGAGDIGAVGKLAATHTGDTLTEETTHYQLEPVEFPEPSYSASVTPKTKADLDKLGQALLRIVEEDPTLHINRDPVTHEMLLSGLGEPHVQIALDRLTRRYGVNVDVGLPRVQYRETISDRTIAEYKHKKQTGGAGQYGHVFLELEPLPDAEFEFSEKVVGGSVPRNFYPAVEKGVREALEAGPLAGYPVVNVKVKLFDGSYHDVDSSEMAFKIAAKEAFKKGVLQAKPVLLEPVLNLTVTVPENFTGDVMSDLNGKRAHVSGMNPAGSHSTSIEAVVPAAEVQRYATDLRSITQGRGAFSTTFSHYQPVPAQLAEQIKAEAAKRREEAHH